NVGLLWLGAGTAETAIHDSTKAMHEALDKAGIRNVFVESPGTAHEWQTWRRALHDFAPRLFRGRRGGTGAGRRESSIRVSRSGWSCRRRTHHGLEAARERLGARRQPPPVDPAGAWGFPAPRGRQRLVGGGAPGVPDDLGLRGAPDELRPPLL